MGIVKKCLVVGGSGFIGSHLVRHLAAQGLPVRVLDRNDMQLEENLRDVPGVEISQGDICNRGESETALVGITDIVYLACSTVPATSMMDYTYDLASNVMPLISLLQFMRQIKSIRRIVYLSSGGAIYGDPYERQPIPESHPIVPISSYGLTKLVAEHYLRLCLSNSEICGYVLRPSNAYGERQNLRRPQGAIGHFLHAAVSNSSIVLYGKGHIVRDYIYAGDIAEAIRLCLQDGKATAGEVKTFNVGTRRGVSLVELVELIQRVTGRTIRIKRRPDRHFDCRYNVLDNSAIRQALGWRPRVALEEGLAITWKWIQAQRRTPNRSGLYSNLTPAEVSSRRSNQRRSVS